MHFVQITRKLTAYKFNVKLPFGFRRNSVLLRCTKANLIWFASVQYITHVYTKLEGITTHKTTVLNK